MMGLSRDALPRDELSGASAGSHTGGATGTAHWAWHWGRLGRPRGPGRRPRAGSPPGAHVYVYVPKAYS